MTNINFTGLASGLDTDLIIKSLMEIGRQPITRLEADKQFHQNRLSTFRTFHEKLSALNGAVGNLYLSSGMRESKVSLSGRDYISATAGNAQPGTYQVTVEQLAQVQKSVSERAYASRTDNVFGTGDLTLIVGGISHTVSITQENNSLSGIMNAINGKTSVHGVSAAIIDNGNENGDRYFLVLSGADSSMEFSLESGLSGGIETLSVEKAQEARSAVAFIDGIRITSKNNTIENAITGVTLTLESVSHENDLGQPTPTLMTISLNKDSVVEKIERFVNAYNDIIAFVAGNPSEEAPEGGIAVKDSLIHAVRRRLQNMLVTQVEGTEKYKALTQLGLTTNKDGTISLDSGKLINAVEENFDDVVNLMAGDNGIFKQYRTYLNNQISSNNGLYATRQENVKNVIARIDKDISQMELRLEKREEMLIKRFTAMENLVSALNAQSDYLKQQIDVLNDMGKRKK